MMELKGTITALITPFNSNGIDLEGLSENIHFQIDSGVNGIFVLGTTGENPTLTEKERIEVIKTAAKETKGKVPLLVGTGTSCTKTTFERSEEAKNLGADFVVIVTPPYNLPSQEGLYRHFHAIHSNCEIPIILYDNPSRSVRRIENETILRLSKLPRIVGIKDSSGDFNKFKELQSLLPFNEEKPFYIFSGNDSDAIKQISAGAHGLFSVTSNLIPKKICDLVKAAGSNDSSLILSLEQELEELFNVLFIESNPVPVKTAMNAWNMPAGPCRLPLCELEENNLLKLMDVLKKYEPLKPPFNIN